MAVRATFTTASAVLGAALLLGVGAIGFMLGLSSGADSGSSVDRLQSDVAESAAEDPAGPSTLVQALTSADDSTTTVPSPPDPIAPGGADPDEPRLYVLTGGLVLVSFEGQRASVVDVDPFEGFDVETLSADESGAVEVNFRRGSQHSQLRAWFDEGPQARLDDHGQAPADTSGS